MRGNTLFKKRSAPGARLERRAAGPGEGLTSFACSLLDFITIVAAWMVSEAYSANLSFREDFDNETTVPVAGQNFRRDDNTGRSVATAPASAQTIKIGLINSYSGFLAQAGDQMQKGIDLYVKEHEKDSAAGRQDRDHPPR